MVGSGGVRTFQWPLSVLTLWPPVPLPVVEERNVKRGFKKPGIPVNAVATATKAVHASTVQNHLHAILWLLSLLYSHLTKCGLGAGALGDREHVNLSGVMGMAACYKALQHALDLDVCPAVQDDSLKGGSACTL